MTAALTLAIPAHLAALLPLCAAFHVEQGIDQTDEGRSAALTPLLEGSPFGAVYLMGPARAPIGYIVICFSWSVEFGGLDAMIDELYVRPKVRGRGIATEALTALPKALAGAGLRAIHLEVDRDDDKTQSLYARARFAPRDRYILMSKVL